MCKLNSTATIGRRSPIEVLEFSSLVREGVTLQQTHSKPLIETFDFSAVTLKVVD